MTHSAAEIALPAWRDDFLAAVITCSVRGAIDSARKIEDSAMEIEDSATLEPSPNPSRRRGISALQIQVLVTQSVVPLLREGLGEGAGVTASKELSGGAFCRYSPINANKSHS